MSITYVDHQTLEKIVENIQIFPDTNDFDSFREQIREKVYRLDKNHRQLIVMYFFENMTVIQIHEETGFSISLINRYIRESLLTLKYSLLDNVKKRWPKKFNNLISCPICIHPDKGAIEKIINSKKSGESWRQVNNRLKKKIGKTFNPPSILINHKKYHTKG